MEIVGTYSESNDISSLNSYSSILFRYTNNLLSRVELNKRVLIVRDIGYSTYIYNLSIF